MSPDSCRMDNQTVLKGKGFKVFSSPCARCWGHRPEDLNDRSRLLLQVLADVEDDGEGDEDDHDAKGKPGQEGLDDFVDECVEHEGDFKGFT